MFVDDEIDRYFRRAFRSFFDAGPGVSAEADVAGPFYYGYTMTVGPDGRPTLREYGNAGPGARPASDSRNLAVETIVDDGQRLVKLVAEMPGVEKSDVKIRVNGRTVGIDAENGKKRYRASVPVKARIDTNSAKASYRNGVLEITFRQLEPEKPAGRVVEVE